MGNVFGFFSKELPENLVSQLPPEIKSKLPRVMISNLTKDTIDNLKVLNETNQIKEIKIENNKIKIVFNNDDYTFINCWKDDDHGIKCGYSGIYSKRKTDETPAKAPATAMYKQSTVL